MTVAEGVVPDRFEPHAIVRLVVGLTQGLFLYLLFESAQSKTWPSTDAPLFAALGTAAIFAPLVLIAGVSYLRPPLLAGWAVVVAAVCAGLAWHDIVRDPLMPTGAPRIYPSPQLGLSLVAGLFIAHCLLVAAAADRRFIARYATYFDISWRYAVQVALVVLFTGAFWLLLRLGAELFTLIKITSPLTLLQSPWFAIPVTTLALTCAVHATDLRADIVRDVRSLGCSLLSWLLPLLALIAVGFVATLPVTGLEPLWSTRRASAILLAAAASLILLINAVYQDGVGSNHDGEPHRLPLFLRISMAAASAVLVPMSLLAVYGISLRIAQHGWTTDRIVAIACAAIAVCYAVGYLAAAVRWNSVFAWLETTNIAVAFLVLAILLALFTPLADPARISVADQMRRLDAGLIAPEKFDYLYLRFDAGRYGVEALRVLAGQKAVPLVAERAAAALALQSREGAGSLAGSPTSDERAANLSVVHPRGQPLPREFLETNWSDTGTVGCRLA